MIKRGEVWVADMDPTRGSEQAGTRPVLILQNEDISRFTSTLITIPFTTNLKRAALPSCVRVSAGEGGLLQDSVLLCHQVRVLDRLRLRQKLGGVSRETISAAESCLLFTLGVF